jgi:uncharacterized membrane protein YccC
VALRHVGGSFIPLIICEILGYEAVGLVMMLGGFIISGVDIAGTFQSKAKALFIITGINILMTFLLLLTEGTLALVVPMLFVFIFGLAFISPFSLRYTLMGVMGYLGIILAVSMAGRIHTTEAILHHCFLLLCGSLWYIVFALIMHRFAGPREINRRVAHCMRQTADYFDQRLELLAPETEHEEGLIALAGMQQELNETQESVRELLYSDTSTLSERSSERRRLYLIFIELVDMHEMAMATPIDDPEIRKLLHRYPEYTIIRKIISQTNREMNTLAEVLLNQANYNRTFKIQDDIEELQQSLMERKKNISLHDSKDEKAYQTLKQIEQYLHRQLQKVTMIRNSVLNRKTYDEQNESSASRADTNLHTRDLPQFITPNPLNWNSLAGNLSFESSYFRYALRTAVTAVAGYTLAHFLHFQNAYWVLLTVLIVMKPGYGVTRRRFYHRIIGTLIGAAIAYGLYLLDPSHLVSLAIFATSLLLAFTFVIHNYAVSSSLFTIFIIFLYSFLQRDIPSMVVFRVIDTVLGAVLVILAIRYLWPYWEHQNFSDFLHKSLSASKKYLQQVSVHLLEGRFDETEYRLARKQAYVEMANVVSSYYRLRDDPESKQMNADFSYDLALLTYMLLSATTSLGIFLQRHPEESFKNEEFHILVEAILVNIDFTNRQLKPLAALKKSDSVVPKDREVENASEALSHRLYDLKNQLDQYEQAANEQSAAYLQYVHLDYLRRQLSWMLDLSRSLAEHAAHPDQKFEEQQPPTSFKSLHSRKGDSSVFLLTL